MKFRNACLCLLILLAEGRHSWAEELLTLRNKDVEIVWAPAGGALVRFQFRDDETNPLNWEVAPDLERRQENAPVLRGHFLCLDRWGAPSAAEQAHGMPFHGEAPQVVWKVEQPPRSSAGNISAEMSCVLPIAGLRVARRIMLDEVRQGRILDRPTYEHLDADEAVSKSYLCFLARVPADFAGVGELRFDGGAIRLRENRDVNPRLIELRTGLNLIPP